MEFQWQLFCPICSSDILSKWVTWVLLLFTITYLYEFAFSKYINTKIKYYNLLDFASDCQIQSSNIKTKFSKDTGISEVSKSKYLLLTIFFSIKNL